MSWESLSTAVEAPEKTIPGVTTAAREIAEAARNGEGPNSHQSFTESLASIRAASTMPSPNGPLSAGGHPRAVSGRCSQQQVPAVIEALPCGRARVSSGVASFVSVGVLTSTLAEWLNL